MATIASISDKTPQLTKDATPAVHTIPVSAAPNASSHSHTTMEQALDRMRGLINYAGDWTELTSYLPEGWEVEPAKRRSAMAANFAATLEMAKRGELELRQGDTFSPIQIRRKTHDG